MCTSANKRQVTAATQQMSEEMDRLLSLPEGVLYNILSYLPTKTVVRTSVLSTKWRYLWTSFPCLNFDEFTGFGGGSPRARATRFIRFVDWVLILHGASIETVHFNCSWQCSSSYIYMWIRAMVMRGVKELEFSVQHPYIVGSFVWLPRANIQFPHCLFNCRTLVVLKLKFNGESLELPASICFPELKTVCLEKVLFKHGKLISKLFSNCPKLENLFLDRCAGSIILNISNHALKSLSIDTFGAPNWRCFRKIKVSCQNLESFVYRGLDVGYYYFDCSPSVVCASLELVSVNEKREQPINQVFVAFPSVKVLKLSCGLIELLSSMQSSLDWLPIFYQLKHLSLSAIVYEDHLRVISFLLKNSPNLEEFWLESFEVLCDDCECLESAKLPSGCIPKHLKIVKISGSMEKNEIILVRSFLESAYFLEQIIIELQHADLETQMVVSQKLLMLPRVSRSCVIDLRRHASNERKKGSRGSLPEHRK
ncbi:hypothetical protein DITRI_Ditri02bG0127500 [Diplodiscus trichospermus]